MWVDELVPLIGNVVKWIDTNQEVLVQIAEYAGIAVAGGVALVGLGGAFWLVAAAAGAAGAALVSR